MIVRVVDEDHHRAPVHKLGTIVRITKNQHGAAERNNDGGVWKRLIVDDLVRSRPQVLHTEERRRDVADEDGRPNCIDPHASGSMTQRFEVIWLS